MRNFSAILKNNLTTVSMIVFVVCFYTLMLWPGHTPENKEALKEAKQSQKLAAEELKTRENTFQKSLRDNPSLATKAGLVIFLVVLTGLILNIYFFIKKRGGASPINYGVPHHPVGWGLQEVCQVFVLLFFMESVILVFEIAVSRVFHIRNLDKDLIVMLNSLLRDIGVAAFVIYLVKTRFQKPLTEIGLTTKDFFKNIRTGIVGYLSIIPFLLGVLMVIAFLAQTFKYEPPPQPVVEMYLNQSVKEYLIFFTFFVAIVGPIIEEIFFRGFTYKAFRTRYGARGAMIASAAIFAALHMNIVAFFPIFVLGLFLAYLYEKTGSLVPCMTLHMTHNLVMVIFTLIFKSLSV